MKLLLIIPIFLLLFHSGCSSTQQDWSEFIVYDKAIDIEYIELLDGLANEVFFKVKAEFPNADVLSYYKKIIKSPWVECSDNNNWESFGDISGSEAVFIHQTVQRWVNRDKNRLLMLGIRYKSQGSKNRRLPDNNIQYVYLVEYIEPNLRYTLSNLGIKCNGV